VPPCFVHHTVKALRAVATDVHSKRFQYIIAHALVYIVAVLLGLVEKLRKATISFAMCVCPSFRPSVRMGQLNWH